MTVQEHYQREVSTIPAEASTFQIVDAMKSDGVGCLIVLEKSQPVGIVTDRDLLCRVLAAGRDPQGLSARDVMSQPLFTVGPEEPLERVIAQMSSHGIRRVPVVRDGELVGIVALDDLVAALGDELKDLGEAVRRAFYGAQRRAWARRLADDLEERVSDWSEQLEQIGGDARQSVARQLEGLRERIRNLRS